MSTRTLIQEWDLSVNNLDTSGLEVTGIDSYDEILVVFSGVNASATMDLRVRLSNDGGTTYESGASDYSYGYIGASGTSYIHDNSELSTRINVAKNNNDATLRLWGSFHVYEPGRSDFKTLVTALTSSPEATYCVAGERETAEVNDALKIFTSTGSCTSGTIKVYGISYDSPFFTLLANHDLSTDNIASGGDTIDVTNIDDYDEIWIRGTGLTADNVNSSLGLRLSNDGGSTFRAGSTDYQKVENYGNGSLNGRGVLADANYMWCFGYGDGRGSFENRIAFADTAACGTVSRMYSAADTYAWMGAGRCKTDEVNDALRIYSRTGTFSAGRILVYGLKYSS